jgi:hypothetical protein
VNWGLAKIMRRGANMRRPMSRVDPGEDTRALQAEIDEALGRLNPGWVHSITLAQGSDVIDLKANAAVDVTPRCGHPREFDVRSAEHIGRLGSMAPWSDGPRAGGRTTDVLACGAALVIVSQITGGSIVRGVLDFVERERAEQAVEWLPSEGEA